MIPPVRQKYNNSFTEKKYQALQDYIAQAYNHRPPFKIAETPVFIPNTLKTQLFDACEQIMDVICAPNFKNLTKGALLPENLVPNEDEHTLFLQMDFGVCQDEDGNLSPQLIEIQGFPSLYYYQDLAGRAYKKFFEIPDEFSHLLDGLSSEDYHELLRKNIVGSSDPKHVILLEVEPFQQTTLIDFLGTAHHTGLQIKCVSDLKVDGKDVYYLNEQGHKVAVEKIVNRVIFDELIQKKDLKREFYFTREHNVEWIGHPHWFFRISKYTLPFLDSPYVPKTQFLNKIDTFPDDLENYVLKPLYSFAGTGVMININRYDLDAITDKENYILQRKVNYAPVVATPDGKAKCEIRMLMIWEKGKARPVIINNLTRLSKGEMIGVRYNKGKTWVGGSVGFFES